MNKSTIALLVAAGVLLSGCQNMMKTMVAHIRIDNNQTFLLADTNARTNFCLAKQKMDRRLAYDFSNIASAMLDMVVFDNDFYKNTYERHLASLEQSYRQYPAAVLTGCQELESTLPQAIATLRMAYGNYARELGRARAEENQQLAQMMSNFRVPNTPMPPLNFPPVRYSQERPVSQDFLVYSNSGISQCRVTTNNFVFCL